MNTLEVQGLCKDYERFHLKDISFSLEPGTITGFIGRNGAGKTTTLKAIMGFVHPDAGKVCFWGENFKAAEFALKQRIGFVSGGVDYYPKKKIKTISAVSKRFYENWNESAYRECLDTFDLDEEKTPDELSAGMKVKYALTLALSHNADLLILDEPTSGLDPVSRDDLLDVFLNLVQNAQVSILFSTHITSDLEKCADNIIYIKDGSLVTTAALDDFLARYKTVELTELQVNDSTIASKLIGIKRDRKAYRALVETAHLPLSGIEACDASLEDIMVHMEKGE